MIIHGMVLFIKYSKNVQKWRTDKWLTNVGKVNGGYPHKEES
jgi:hypothetical protein